MDGGATTSILGNVVTGIFSGYGDYLDSRTQRDRVAAARDVGIAQANASATQGLVNSQQFQLVLLGAAVLVGIMVWKSS